MESISRAEAKEHGRRMADQPKALTRPVVVLSGWRSASVVSKMLASRLQTLTGAGEADIVPYWFTKANTFDEAAQGLIERVDDAWPSDDDTTVEVDAVGFSMGGLVVEHAATWNKRQLRVKRLFTVVTPHRGASLAKWIALDPAAKNMKPGSEFLEELESLASEAIEERVCYGRLRDWWVGATNTAPHGHDPIWVPTPWWTLGHMRASGDPRIVVDIAKRLRGEDPVLRVTGPAPTN